MKIEQFAEGISLKRSVDAGTADQRKAVQDIIYDVRKSGNTALHTYTERFDGVSPGELLVSEQEMEEATAALTAEQLDIIQEAANNIRMFHEKKIRKSWFTTDDTGTILGQKLKPLDSVGIYLPGGTAASTSGDFLNAF